MSGIGSGNINSNYVVSSAGQKSSTASRSSNQSLKNSRYQQQQKSRNNNISSNNYNNNNSYNDSNSQAIDDPMDQDAYAPATGQVLLGASSQSSYEGFAPASMIKPGSPNRTTVSSISPLMATGSSTISSTSNGTATSSTTDSRTLLKRLSISSGFYAGCVEIIKDILYFWVQPSAVVQASLNSRRPPTVPSNAIPLFVDYDYNYTHFYLDFGPLNIAHIYRFCKSMQTAYQSCRIGGKRIVVATSEAPNKCTNAALLVSAFLLLELGYSTEEACRPFLEYRSPSSGMPLPIVSYRDAGYGPATYWISIQDCCHVLEKGIRQFQLIDLSRFDLEEYEFYEQMQNGDFNWIIPGFFLAHATPHDSPPPNLLQYHEEVNAGRIVSLRPRNPRFQPLIDLDKLLAYMKSERLSVRAIVRLNNKLYDRNRVLGSGIQHYELYFADGSNPPIDPIVKQFMMICDNHLPYHRLTNFQQHPECGPLVNLEPEERRAERGALAIHCKAGLGRTGTLICCWMIKNLGWNARECISWCRLMRPGSVVGPQQNWLESMEGQLMAWGRSEREQRLAAMQEFTKSLTMTSGGLAKAESSSSSSSRRQQQQKNNIKIRLDQNHGTEVLTETSMGMRVPVQPNKLERAAAQLSSTASSPSSAGTTGKVTGAHYYLRSNSTINDDDHGSNGSGGSSTPRSRNDSQTAAGQGGLRASGIMTRSRSRTLAENESDGSNNNSFSNNSSMLFHV